MNEARTELLSIMKEESLKNVILLVLANKQDLEGAMSPAEITEKLCLKTLPQGAWFVQTTCAATGEGLTEGLDWLASQVSTGIAASPGRDH
ncbi:hypothetical protein CBR_g5686 [Chara braunii]|uniref:Uncharacterized protein n=1 Tax=Chara braunii TaxID=69332 RepID=A0A388JRW0_CHABU|nr:hypothetical protein CBR_g5686 [Chara braunii]|eukprot:GBG60510.1 hypothetical protein CBR_g5686 [Chara braunii]